MKQFNHTVKSLIIAGLTLAATALVSTARADTTTNAPVKPDLLMTCPVSGEKLGEMGKARRSNCAARDAKRISTRTRPNT
jgi:hypothetical protein